MSQPLQHPPQTASAPNKIPWSGCCLHGARLTPCHSSSENSPAPEVFWLPSPLVTTVTASARFVLLMASCLNRHEGQGSPSHGAFSLCRDTASAPAQGVRQGTANAHPPVGAEGALEISPRGAGHLIQRLTNHTHGFN